METGNPDSFSIRGLRKRSADSIPCWRMAVEGFSPRHDAGISWDDGGVSGRLIAKRVCLQGAIYVDLGSIALGGCCHE